MSRDLRYDQDYYNKRAQLVQVTDGGVRIYEGFAKDLRPVAKMGYRCRAKTWLDIGSGIPIASIALATGFQAEWEHYIAIDLHPYPAQVSKEWSINGKGIDFIIGSATDLPFRDQSIDLAFTQHLLEHIDDTRGADDCARVALSWVHVVPLGFRDDPTHRRQYRKEDIQAFANHYSALAHMRCNTQNMVIEYEFPT